jgi:hypothetical protein
LLDGIGELAADDISGDLIGDSPEARYAPDILYVVFGVDGIGLNLGQFILGPSNPIIALWEVGETADSWYFTGKKEGGKFMVFGEALDSPPSLCS